MIAPRQAGFTIVELLVALLIFGMLAASGIALLSFSVRAQEMSDARLGELAKVRRAGAILTADLAQAAPRLVRDADGAASPAFSGGPEGEIALVRRGWSNIDGSPRSSLQKVRYSLVGDRLERLAWRHVDGGPALAPAVLLEGVRSVRARYRDQEGAWRDRWDPARPIDMPRAVEIVIDTERYGPVRQLFLVGTGA